MKAYIYFELNDNIDMLPLPVADTTPDRSNCPSLTSRIFLIYTSKISYSIIVYVFFFVWTANPYINIREL